VARTRLAVGLISLAAIGLELALMRTLSLRFWHHFAYMVISVALLGFGASGTVVVLLRRRIVRRRRAFACACSVAFALSVPLAAWAARLVPLDVQFLAWDLSQLGHAAVLELLMFVPFLLAGATVGVILTDRPERISGHYAANLIGSGAGAVGVVALMFVLPAEQLLVAVSVCGYLAGAALVAWRRAAPALGGVAAGAALVVLSCLAPGEPVISQYKMLSYARTLPGTTVKRQGESPLGRIDLVSGPHIHHAPGLSLQFARPIPQHQLLIVDGERTSAIYDCKEPGDWAFLDYTTAALPYHLRPKPEVLIIGAGGGSGIGLAAFHKSRRIVALEMNAQIIEAMTGPLLESGGSVYRASNVRVINREARGYLASATDAFDVIQLSATDAFGASGAGLHAAQESYLYTVESVAAMLDHLAEGGLLSITRRSRTPPRGGLRVFDLVARALRKRGLPPQSRMMMIRSWATVTVLASDRPFTQEETDAVRAFCRARSFDLCYLPGLAESEANQFHVLDRPYFFEGVQQLLSEKREAFLHDYIFEVAATTDDRPFFYSFFRWRSLPLLRRQLKGRTPAFLEIGYLLLIAALCQAVVFAAVFIVLPLAPRIKSLRGVRGKPATLAYFALLGLGFMLLEIGFLQKLILYLAHPIYSAAAAIGSFLLFGGIGSQLSRFWAASLKRVATVAAAVVVCLALAYLLVLDRWLALTQASAIWLRFLIAAATVAPLAVAMGHMFPAGLRRVASAYPALVPWAWAVNGSASVVATIAAPLAAMHFGFSRVLVTAVACYALAGVLCRLLPEGRLTPAAPAALEQHPAH